MAKLNFDACKELFMQARNRQDWEQVIYWATELLYFDENLPWVWASRANGLHHLGQYLDATLSYDRALVYETRKNLKAEQLCNKGASYWDMGNGKQAMKYLAQSLEIHPIPQCYMTMGNIYKYQNNLETAIECYRKAIEIDHDYADGHLMLSMALLKNKQLPEGWAEYEWRWKTAQLPERKLTIPWWRHQDLNGKRIMVYGEQGLGDIVHFARYVDQLKELYPDSFICVEGRPPVARLLASQTTADMVLDVGEEWPQVDYQIPMVSLCAALTPTYDSIKGPAKFTLSPIAVKKWGNKLDEVSKDNPGLRIGVCWAGMARTGQPQAARIDSLRSMALADMAPLAQIPGILWVSLQKGPPADQIKKPPLGMKIVDMTDDMVDFYETACAIRNLDLVITVDTAVAHVAACTDKPVWMLSRWDGCWRWFGDGLRNPWYPSMVQFVQHKPEDWSGVMAVVAGELDKFVKNKN